MYTVSREYWFSAAHMIEGHPKCGRLHGHNYKVVVSISGWTDPGTGMLVDYAVMDEHIKPVVNMLDHMLIAGVNNDVHVNPYLPIARDLGHLVRLPVVETTAEELAKFFCDELSKVIKWRVYYISVRVHETPKSTADYGD